MSEDVRVKKAPRQDLHRWFAGNPGCYLLQREMELLDEVLPDLFGYHLLQVGRVGTADMLSASRILHRAMVEVDGDPDSCAYPCLLGAPQDLPIASDSVDVVVLTHVLEYAPSAHDTLREAQRVLVPEGRLLVLGFNPWSWLGIWRLILRRYGKAPWRGRFLGLNRMRDWLALLGFDELAVKMHFFRPPFRNEGLMARLYFMEVLGQRLWPYLAGAYLLVAKKRVATLTPLRPQWQPRRHLVAVGVARPSARISHAKEQRSKP
jgi:SAM-dependent methyltransferase